MSNYAVEKIDELRDRLRIAEAEVRNLRGAMAAQDEREQKAAARLGMAWNCDWPDAVADEVERLRKALEKPMSEPMSEPIKAGDWVQHVANPWDEPCQVERVDSENFPDDPVAFFVGGGFWRTSRISRVDPPRATR